MLVFVKKRRASLVLLPERVVSFYTLGYIGLRRASVFGMLQMRLVMGS